MIARVSQVIHDRHMMGDQDMILYPDRRARPDPGTFADITIPAYFDPPTMSKHEQLPPDERTWADVNQRRIKARIEDASRWKEARALIGGHYSFAPDGRL
jgi:hypothetical protein